jgi:hypothetical protein
MIIQILIIIGINIVAGVLCFTAFLLLVFRHDPVLAAVPDVLAIPAVLAQPWFIPFFLLPGGPILAPVLTSVVSAFLYTFLDRRGRLDWAKRQLCRMNTRGKAFPIFTRLRHSE